jgi:hypothetical protein
MSLIEESKKWYKDATDLLQATDLVKLLSKYGEPIFNGSYAYELMFDSDIDIFLLTDNPSREMADSLAKDLINSGHWTSFMYCDWPTNNPKGPYFCVKQDFKGHRWKVDILTISQQELDERLPAREKYYNLTDKQKEQVFKFKIDRANGYFAQDTPTVFIYDAVLDGVDDLEGLKKYLNPKL